MAGIALFFYREGAKKKQLKVAKTASQLSGCEPLRALP
jgi:hypothetical protein